MKLTRRFTQLTGLFIASVMMTPVFAQPAPVYDADNMQQQNAYPQQDENNDMSSARNQEPESGFVRVENEATPVVAAQAPAPSNANERSQRLEEQMRLSPNGEAIAKMESLQEQVQSLRGQVEQLTHQLEQLQLQQKNLYSELDKRQEQSSVPVSQTASVAPAIATATPAPEAPTPSVDEIPVKRVEISKPVKTAATETPSAKQKPLLTPLTKGDVLPTAQQPNVAEEQKIYQSAYNLIKQKKYNDAVTVLQKMLNKYPSGQFASNAHYWLGELFGLLGKNDDALSEFSVIVKTYPRSPRISDAQLKVGLILASQLKWSDAKLALKRVINQYPGTSSAKVATEQLKQISQAGH